MYVVKIGIFDSLKNSRFLQNKYSVILLFLKQISAVERKTKAGQNTAGKVPARTGPAKCRPGWGRQSAGHDGAGKLPARTGPAKCRPVRGRQSAGQDGAGIGQDTCNMAEKSFVFFRICKGFILHNCTRSRRCHEMEWFSSDFFHLRTKPNFG